MSIRPDLRFSGTQNNIRMWVNYSTSYKPFIGHILQYIPIDYAITFPVCAVTDHVVVYGMSWDLFGTKPLCASQPRYLAYLVEWLKIKLSYANMLL